MPIRKYTHLKYILLANMYWHISYWSLVFDDTVVDIFIRSDRSLTMHIYGTWKGYAINFTNISPFSQILVYDINVPGMSRAFTWLVRHCAGSRVVDTVHCFSLRSYWDTNNEMLNHSSSTIVGFLTRQFQIGVEQIGIGPRVESI